MTFETRTKQVEQGQPRLQGIGFSFIQFQTSQLQHYPTRIELTGTNGQSYFTGISVFWEAIQHPISNQNYVGWYQNNPNHSSFVFSLLP